MRSFLRLIYLSVLFLFLCATIYPSNYYVDKNANGSNNGTSWANAWESFSSINWGSIQPGDIVYISGGTDSTTYPYGLSIQGSGSAGNYITIRNSYDTGHNGRVIIRNSGGNGSSNSGNDYIYLKGLEIRNANGYGTYYYNCDHIVFDSLIVKDNNGIGLWSEESSYFEIKNCIVESKLLFTGGADDNILFQKNAHHIFIHDNYLHQRNQQAAGAHIDNIQFANYTHSAFIYNNIAIVDSGVQGHNFILGVGSDNYEYEDTVLIYNNYLYNGGASGCPWYADNIYNREAEGRHNYNPYAITINNTLVSANNTIFSTRDGGRTAFAHNNIMLKLGQNGGAPTGCGQPHMAVGGESIDSFKTNVFYQAWNGGASFSGSLAEGYPSNWAGWISLGGNGVNDDPEMSNDVTYYAVGVNLPYVIAPTSPAIDAGTDMSYILDAFDYLPGFDADTDIEGNVRDGTWDIGCYEYKDRGPDITPPDVTGAALLDSVTLRITFSEPLDPPTAQNPNNYSINNGIAIVSALLTGSVVTLTTSPHSNGAYTVTVSNVEDIAGNIVSPTANSADYDWTVIQDITPPEVTGATLLDSVTLKIMFSETLDESTAEDESNYSISNNIDVFNASLSGSEVTLQTTAHSPGSYIVTVVNVEDLAGNPISQSNTAEYSFIPPDSLMMFTIEDVEGVIQEPGHTPLKTIDGLGALHGDPDSRWAAEPMPEELIFDLGLNRTVCKTRLSFFRWNLQEVFTYSILTSSDHNNWVTIVSQATSAYQEEWTIDEFPAVDARYVKVLFINNNQSNWAGLWEGEIWGINLTHSDPPNNDLPNSYSLNQNYPNPFNPSTTISYSIPAASFVTIKVYDALGNEVVRLVNEEKPEGSYEIMFDAANLPSGIYFYRLQAGLFVETKKMVLMK